MAPKVAWAPLLAAITMPPSARNMVWSVARAQGRDLPATRWVECRRELKATPSHDEPVSRHGRINRLAKRGHAGAQAEEAVQQPRHAHSMFACVNGAHPCQLALATSGRVEMHCARRHSPRLCTHARGLRQSYEHSHAASAKGQGAWGCTTNLRLGTWNMSPLLQAEAHGAWTHRLFEIVVPNVVAGGGIKVRTARYWAACWREGMASKEGSRHHAVQARCMEEQQRLLDLKQQSTAE